MKQKLVINVNFNGNKSRSKAMKIAVGFAESVAIGGQDKNKIEVVGDGVDAVGLTSLLRKRLGYAVLETVAPVEKKETKPDAAPTPPQIQPAFWPIGPSQHVYVQHPYQYVYEHYPGHYPNYCSFL